MIYFHGKIACAQEVNDSTLLINTYSKGLNSIFSNPDMAIFYLTSVSPKLEKEGWNDKFIYSEIGLYLANKNKGQFEEALPHIDGLMKIAKTLCGEKSKAFAFSANTLFYHYEEKGDYQNAFKMAKIALKVFQNTNPKEQNKLGIAVCLSNLGMISQKLGDFDESLQYNLLAIIKKKEILAPGNRELLKSYQNLALLYEAMGDYPNALKLLHKKKNEIIHFPPFQHEKMLIDCINAISYTHLLSGNSDSVLFYIHLNEQIQEKNRSNYYPQIKYDLLSQISENEGDLKQALVQRKMMHLERQLFLKNLPRHPKIAESFASIAALYMKIDSLDQASKYLDSAERIFVQKTKIPLVSSFENSINAIPILHQKANFYAKKKRDELIEKDPFLAEYYFYLTDSLIEKVKTGIQNEGSKLLFSKEIHPFYESAISFFYQKGGKENLEKAFYFAEKSKASLLQFGLQDAGAKINAGVPDSLIQREKELKLDIAFYENLIFKEEQKEDQKDVRKLTSWRSILIQRDEKKKALIRHLNEEYPKYHQLKYAQNIPSIEQVHQELSDEELLIEYFFGEESIYVFSISQKKFEVHKIDRDENFNSKLIQLLNELHRPSEGVNGFYQFIESSSYLYQKLLEPILESKNKKELIIIPDGPLALLPFGAFLTDQVAIQNDQSLKNLQRAYRSLPYLFQSTTCRYEFSSKLLTSNILREKKAHKEVLAYAPSYSGNLNLTFNKSQALGLVDIMGGDVFLGKDALKNHFLATGEAYRLIHFAAHGFPDTISPLRAHVLFFDSTGDCNDSSRLFAYDIYNMSLNAKLVVLAACETAYGKIEQGEGVMSLNRAFRYAGSSGIISSLWKADGRSSNKVMLNFYNELDGGGNMAKSLNEAKRKFLKSAPGNQIHPYYWANYTFYGRDQPLQKNNHNDILLIFIFLFLGVGYLFYKRSR